MTDAADVSRGTYLPGNDPLPERAGLSRKGAAWSDWEQLQLQMRLADGQTHAEIGAALGRSAQSVRMRAFLTGLAKPNRRGGTKRRAAALDNARAAEALADRLAAAGPKGAHDV